MADPIEQPNAGGVVDGYVFLPNPNGAGGKFYIPGANGQPKTYVGTWNANSGGINYFSGFGPYGSDGSGSGSGNNNGNNNGGNHSSSHGGPFMVPTAPTTGGYSLPWYPTTQDAGTGIGTYQGLWHQLQGDLVRQATHDPFAQQFNRFNFAGPAGANGGAPYPHPNPFPVPNGPPTPPGNNSGNPIGGAPLPPIAPGTPRTPVFGPTQDRTQTPTGGPLAGAPQNPLVRTSTPYSGLLGGATPPPGGSSMLGHPATPGTGDPNPMVRTTTPYAPPPIPSTPTPGGGTSGPPARSALGTPQTMSANDGAPAAPPPNNAGMYAVPNSALAGTVNGFRFSGTSDAEKNYNYLADKYSPRIAEQYLNTQRGSLLPLLYGQTQGTAGLAQQIINTAGAGGTGSQYSGGSSSGVGGNFWTGLSAAEKAAGGFAGANGPMGFQTTLPYGAALPSYITGNPALMAAYSAILGTGAK